jgi:hypothetical protein
MKEQLTAIILDFIVVVARCWKTTNTAQDRAVYQEDAAIAAWWIAQLQNTDANAVAEDILSPQTKKHFYDYWRAGECGEAETNAFVSMTSAIESLLTPR